MPLNSVYTCTVGRPAADITKSSHTLSFLAQVIPLESTMKRPRNMPLVLDAAAVTVVGINLPFALSGYFFFGSETEGIYSSRVCVYVCTLMSS